MHTTKHISILTLVYQRRNALRNMLRGIASGSMYPAEVVIVHMNEHPYDFYDEYPFPIRAISLATDGPLNLSLARNTAMEHATTPYAIFLDVDCIPETPLLAQYKLKFEQQPELVSGRVRYLPNGFDQVPNWSDRMYEISTPDPVRSALSEYPYELFWSLNFGCAKDTFERIGGFDEAYLGYGGEDTDFAFNAREKGVSLQTIDTLAFHQHHPTYDPPVDHLKSIVGNATYFRRKWGRWPMEGWLRSFEEKGFIHFTDEEIILLNEPTPQDAIQFLRD
ncbi:glycosyltransferase family 2 protein [Sphingobacterium haloxyli]|nr:galactosyltransferase-related protein [Sphingobacterium haloxyli]